MQNNRWVQILVVLLVLIASAWLVAQVWSFLFQFYSILLLFFVSWLLAFILRPLARWMTGRGLPYGLSVAVVYLGLGLLITAGSIYLVPQITEQITNFIGYVQTGTLIDDGKELLIGWGLNDKDVDTLYTEIARNAQTQLVGALQSVGNILGSLATFFFQLILVFLLSFYFMKDGERIGTNLLNLLPPRWQDELRLATLSIEKSFGGFIRGQIVFALAYAVLTAILMVAPPFHLNFWLIASIIAGLCMLIPLVGNLLALAPPMLVLLLEDQGEYWIWFFAILFIVQSLMVNVLSPRIMSSAIGIHPVYVWAAILVGSQVAGIWGAIFGIPIAGALNLIGRPVLRRIRYQTTLYRESQVPSPSTASFLTGPLAASLAESKSQFETAATAQAVPAPVAPSPAQAPEMPTTSLPTRPVPTTLDDDEDIIVRPSPTLTARAWRLTFVLLSKLRLWARARVQARASRQ